MHAQHEIIPKHETRNSRNYRLYINSGKSCVKYGESTGQKTSKSQPCAV